MRRTSLRFAPARRRALGRLRRQLPPPRGRFSATGAGAWSRPRPRTPRAWAPPGRAEEVRLSRQMLTSSKSTKPLTPLSSTLRGTPVGRPPGRLRRAHRVAVLAAVIALIPALISYADAMLQRSDTALGVRTVEWIRDNG